MTASPPLDANRVLWSGCLGNVDFPMAVQAAAASGHGMLTVSERLYQRSRVADGLSDTDLRNILTEHGVTVHAVHMLLEWLPGERRARSDDGRPRSPEEFIAMATALGAGIVCAWVAGLEFAIDQMAERFQTVCRLAAAAGLSVALEPVPFSSARDIATGWEIVRRAGEPNGGLIFDTWHFARAGGDLEALRTVPGERIFSVQLVDGPRQPEQDLLQAAFRNRLPPGAGELDLAGMLRVLDEIGATAPIGAEASSNFAAGSDPVTVARELAERVDAALDVAERSADRVQTTSQHGTGDMYR